jgi:hypothetical protein
MADLRIDLAAEFKGKKAFKEADKATTSLDKAVGKLGKQIASVFAASKIIAFGKASLNAFVADEKAANQLSVAVKNLGLAFAQPQINDYITKLESTTGILDDQLRPAFQALLTTTGSLTKSQELLGLAIEGARGSGKDLTTVATDLAQAYVGNTRGLRKYNLGLTQAELKTASFAKVQAKFQQQFGGANQAYLATYAGKLEILTVASDRAKETIGKGLVDALNLAGGQDGDIQDIANAMQSLSTYTADVIRGLGVLSGKISGLGGGFLGKIIEFGMQNSIPNLLAKIGKESQNVATGASTIGDYNMSSDAKKYAAARAKAEADAKKRAMDLAKATKSNTAELKKQAILKKAGSIFDLEQIQLIAALKGKLSDEDRKRVELQFALLTGNTKEAQLLTYELAKAQGLTDEIAKSLASLPQAANPFASWSAYLDELMAKARSVASMGAAPSTNLFSSAYMGTGTGQGGSVMDNYLASIPQTNVASMPSTADIARLAAPIGRGSSTIGDYLNVTLQIDGKTIASALQDTSLSGIGSSVNRTGR